MTKLQQKISSVMSKTEWMTNKEIAEKAKAGLSTVRYFMIANPLVEHQLSCFKHRLRSN